MKWPFVRRTRYENAMIYGINTAKEITEKISYIHKLEDQIEIYRKLHDEYAQLNHDNLVEINRLNQELASELNSHRETKEQKNELSAECDRLYDEVDNLKNDLKETKEHEQKLFDAHDKLNQQNMGLLFEVKQWKEATDFWMGKAARAKSEISKVRGILKTIAKKL